MAKRALAETPADSLSKKDLLQVHRLMVEARVLEETLIAMYRRGDGYFWIGGAGEEAFNVAMGLQVRRGEGPAFDYHHWHYRQSATFLAMGGDPRDPMRQMKNTALDPFSRGRNFVNHFAVKAWNICPVASTIGTQYAQAPGTAWVQRRHGGEGISIVTGGDAGAAEGDFASCLIWASRPGQEVPLLILLTNNEYGISTRRDTQWPMREIIRRADPFGIPTAVVDGNDFFASWDALREAVGYVRRERKPYALQANVSRLHGHSSASGAERADEEDALARFEAALVERGVAKPDALAAVQDEVRARFKALADEVRAEPQPEPESIFEQIYAEAP